MKLSNLTAKLTSITQSASIKRNALRALAVATLAGAALAAAPAAQAQRFAIAVRVGPRYIAPAPPVVVYNTPGYYGYAAPVYGYDNDRRFNHDWDRNRDVRYDHQRYDNGHFDHGHDGRR
jgi:hypothetical protein